MITISSFWLYIFLPLVIINLFLGLQNAEKIDAYIEKNNFLNKKTIDSILIFLFICLPFSLIAYFWFFPNVYIVNNCNSFNEKILVNPFYEVYGKKLEFGNHCYVINKSDNILQAKTNFYGANLGGELYVNYNNIDENDFIEIDIKPKDVEKININNFDYILIDLPSFKTFTKHENNYKYSLNCK